MIAIILLPFYIVLNWLLCKFFLEWLDIVFNTKIKKVIRIIIHFLFQLISLSLYYGIFFTNNDYRRVIHIIGNTWYGMFIYAYMLLAVLAVFRLIVRLFKKSKKREPTFSRWQTLIIGIIYLVLLIGLMTYGLFHARKIDVNNYNVTVNKECDGLENLKVVLVADMHMGYSVNTSMMQDMVDKINAQNPDLVVFAGDIYDNDYYAIKEPEKIIEIFSSIKSKYGTFACYGNHDIDELILGGFTFSGDNKEASLEMDNLLAESNVKLLQDEGVLIDNKFYLFGRPDRVKLGRGIYKRKKPKEIVENLDVTKPIFVIDHRPEQFEELAEAGVDLDFSGHTHAGQFFPLNLTSKITWKNPWGIYVTDNMTNITTSGVGFYGPPIRIGSDAEVAVVNVTFK